MNTGDQTGNTKATSDPADPTGYTARDPVGQGGMGSIQQGSNAAPSSQMPGAFDNDSASATSIKSGVPGNSDDPRTTGTSAARDTVDTNKPLPSEPSTGAYSSSNPSGAGPHSSGLASKLDPRADSDRDGSKGLGGQGMAGGTAGTTGGTMGDRTTGSTTESGRSFPLGGASSNTASSGPHTSSIANTADPRVDSDRDGSQGLGPTAGYGSGTGAAVGSTHQGDLSRSGPGRSTGAATGAMTGAATGEPLPKGYGPESWSHDHLRHGHEYAGDPCANEPPASGAVHFTSGPHSLDTANRLDPHVSGGGIGAPSSTTGGSHPGTDHHHPGRNAAAGAGLGAAGAAAYGASRDTPGSYATNQQGTTSPDSHSSNLANKADPRVDSALDGKRGTGSSTGTSGMTGGYGSSTSTGSGNDSSGTAPGPHSSSMMNTLDPRVDTDRSRQLGTGSTSGIAATDSSRTTEPSTDQHHHPSRDAFLAGAGGAAAGGAALHQGQKHHGQHAPTDGTSSTGYSNPYPPSSTGTDVGSGPTSSTTGNYGSPTGTTAGPHSSNVANKADPRVDSDLDGRRGMDSSANSAGLASTGKEHHYGRDAGLAGVGAGAGAGAAYAADKHQGSHPNTSGNNLMQPSSTQQPFSGTSTSSSGPASSSGLRHDDGDRAHEDHSARNAALGAGAGAGIGAAGYAAGDQLSKKDLEREREAAHQQELKDQKAAHKQEAKEEKHHQHELEKEKKAHDKAMAKEEAKHQKDESKHHKDEAKEEKKHHGLFSFLHRDKSDKEAKDDEATRKHNEEDSRASAVGTGAGLSEKEKHEQAKDHDRNRLHKDPPPGYLEKKQSEAPEEGYASQGSHSTSLGNKADPSVAGHGDTVDLDDTRDPKGGMIEPVTGLPVDPSKGEGGGGTDSTPVPSNTSHGERTGTSGTATGAGTQEGFGHIMDHNR
ncbi:MAG: hypothetical protein Q9183_001795 [Haloplaca sp. 2 TL-2023]